MPALPTFHGPDFLSDFGREWRYTYKRMTSDWDLLQQFARENSQDAFAEIVRRHLDLVYSAALRQVRSSQLAEEIAQSVFADLARNAGKLKPDTILTAWLYAVTRRTAIDVIRKESRRRLREQIAVEMNDMNATATEWAQIAPLLDDAMAALDETDRSAILLRYFENKSLREIGEAMGASEDAAQKRVSRTVERLREFFSKRKVMIGASGLVVLISVNAVQSAPAGLAAVISTTALAGTAVSASTVITATKTIAMTLLQKAIIGATLTAAIGTGIFEARRAAHLREQNHVLQQQQASLTEQIGQLRRERDDAVGRLANLSKTAAPRLPAPQVHLAAPPAEVLRATNLYARLKDLPAKLTHEQVEPYLKANGRDAASLLAAFRTTGDPALLKEAMEKYPNNPQVAFEAAFSKDLSPAEQRQWLDTFEKSAPDNALANYLSALNYFNSGPIDEGVQELAAASGKSLDDYTVSRAENDMEAYLAAGYSVADAEQLGTSQLLLPQLAQLKQLVLDCSDLANAYRQAGDITSADTVLQMADKLGQQYANPSAGEPTISQLVGIAMERIALGAMDPNAPYGDNGQTVQDRLDQLAQLKTTVKSLFEQGEPLLEAMSEQDWISYIDRDKAYGEEAAMQWALRKFGGK